MKLMVMAYTNEAFETEIDMADVDNLYVRVVTGDEIVTAHMKDGSEHTFDADVLSGYGRQTDYYDGDYGIHSEDFDEWMKRKGTYEWLTGMKFV